MRRTSRGRRTTCRPTRSRPRPSGGVSSPTRRGRTWRRRWHRMPAAVAETEHALAGLAAHGATGAAEAAWAAGLVRQCVAAGCPPPAGALARLLAGMTDVTVRDATWFTLDRQRRGGAPGLLERRRPALPGQPRRGARVGPGLRGLDLGAGGPRLVCRRPGPRGRPGLPVGRPARRGAHLRDAAVGLGADPRRPRGVMTRWSRRARRPSHAPASCRTPAPRRRW